MCDFTTSTHVTWPHLFCQSFLWKLPWHLLIMTWYMDSGQLIGQLSIMVGRNHDDMVSMYITPIVQKPKRGPLSSWLFISHKLVREVCNARPCWPWCLFTNTCGLAMWCMMCMWISLSRDNTLLHFVFEEWALSSAITHFSHFVLWEWAIHVS